MAGACPPVVDAAWVKAQLDSGSKLRIVDVGCTREGDMHEDYLKSHLPGAVYLHLFQGLSGTSEVPFPIPSPEVFQQWSRERGIDDDTHVVVYAQPGMFGFVVAARAWWLFRLFGHSLVSVLEGGLKAWTDAGQPSASGEETVAGPGSLTSAYNGALIRTYEDVVANISSQAFQLLDTRPPNLYKGSADDPRSGHILGAVSLPPPNLADPEKNRYRTKDELCQAFSTAGVDLSRPLTVSCMTGMVSCMAALGACVCGKEDVPVYLGSYSEWKSKAAQEHIEKS